MGKLLIWAGLAVAILLVIRIVAIGKRRDAEAAAREAGQGGSGSDRPGKGAQAGGRGDADRDPPRELMMQCARCAVHVPSSEAVFAGGKVYCSAAHRDQARQDAT